MSYFGLFCSDAMIDALALLAETPIRHYRSPCSRISKRARDGTMKQTIFINTAHKYVWLPVFGKSVWMTPLIVIILCILALFSLLSLPTVTGRTAVDTFVILAALALAILASRNRASGQYYGEAQTISKVGIFVILMFIAYAIVAAIHILNAGTPQPDAAAFFDQDARLIFSNAAIACLVTSTTAFFWPTYTSQIRDFGSPLTEIVARLGEPLKLGINNNYADFQKLVDRASDALVKVSALELPDQSRDAANRLSRNLADLKSWLVAHNSALITKENTQIMGRLEAFREALSRG